MTDMQWDIERIVRDVVQRLAAHEPQPSATVKGPTTAAPAATKGSNAPELVVSDRVVTLQTLEGQLAGVRRVVLRPDAVVTPSVRDELIRHNVMVVRGTTSRQSCPRPAPLVVGTAATDRDPEAWVKAAEQSVGAARRLATGELTAVVEELVGAVTSAPVLAVLLTGQPAAALCLANRYAGVRAAWGTDQRAVKHAVDSIGANVLVVDPAGRSLFEIGTIVRQFAEGGPRECPAAYRGILHETASKVLGHG